MGEREDCGVVRLCLNIKNLLIDSGLRDSEGHEKALCHDL